MVQAFGEPMTNAAALRCRMLHLDKGLFLNYNEHCSVWGDSMNKAVTTKEEILKIGRELIRQQGWAAINIRAVAAACGVSVGSIYNYFTSKADLVGAIVESVWHEIFHRSEDETVFRDIQACIAWLYQQMEYGHKQYPGFFALHSLSFIHEEKVDGKKRMQQTWEHMLNGLRSVLEHDPNIRPDAFDRQFTVEKFADVLFSLMLSALLRQDYDPSTAQEITRRMLYESPATWREF